MSTTAPLPAPFPGEAFGYYLHRMLELYGKDDPLLITRAAERFALNLRLGLIGGEPAQRARWLRARTDVRFLGFVRTAQGPV